MSLLVFNAGSTTLKFALYGKNSLDELVAGLVDWAGAEGQAEFSVRSPNGAARKRTLTIANHGEAVGAVLSEAPMSDLLRASPAIAVGHRVVHGGAAFHESVIIDAGVRATIEELTSLAPLHQPPALQTLDAAQRLLPHTRQVAVFDTAFFAHLPPAAHVYPLPYEWYEKFGVRRFGFHGISHAYCAERAAEMLKRSDARIVICHLGGGCSASVVKDGRPVATTMGFTPMEGLMMGKRSGSVDPGILIHMQQAHGFTPQTLDHALNHESGLLGVSGVSSDYRKVQEAADGGNTRAKLALDIFANRVLTTIGSLAVTLGGMDALVFTAGIGENSPSLRASVCANLECLGVRLDPAKNSHVSSDSDVSAEGSAVRVLVIHTREEARIASEARRLQ